MRVRPYDKIFEAACRKPALWIEPDAFLRYLPIIDWIKYQSPAVKILELGSGDFGLSTYLPCALVKVDLSFSRLPRSLSSQIAADAVALPFRDDSFDLVFAVDLFEHVYQQARVKVLAEMLRVSAHHVLAVFPCGAKARLQDLGLALYYERKWSKKLDILKVHERMPFPEEDEIEGWLKPQLAKIQNWRVRKSFNLTLRGFLARGWLMQIPWVLNMIRFCLNFPGIFRFGHLGECYRRILSIRKDEGSGYPSTSLRVVSEVEPSFDKLRMSGVIY